MAAPYFQPRLAANLPRGLHMLLCALAVPATLRTPSGGLGADRVRAFLEEYFVECEGPAALESSAVKWLLDAYRGDEIALVDLDHFDLVPDPEPPAD
jgi:hypothetical protein